MDNDNQANEITKQPAALPPPERRDTRDGFRGCVRFVASLLIVILLGVLLGLGIFYGLPALYRQYVLPMETSIRDLENSRALQEQSNEQIGARLDELVGRIDELELQGDTTRQSFDEIDSRLAAVEEGQASVVEDQERLMATAAADLAAWQSESETQAEQFDADLNDLEQLVAENSDALAALETEFAALQDQVATEIEPVQAMRLELQIVKAMELLTRGRLFLFNNNMGLAETEILEARALLSDLSDRVTGEQAAILDEIIGRLDAALIGLPDRPILAGENLELAWQLLRDDWPGPPLPAAIAAEDTDAQLSGEGQATESANATTPETTVAASAAAEATESPDLTPTPTPAATPTPTPTPGS